MPAAEEGSSRNVRGPDASASDQPSSLAESPWRGARGMQRRVRPPPPASEPLAASSTEAGASTIAEPDAEAPPQPAFSQLTSGELARLLVGLGVDLDLATAVSMSSHTVRAALVQVLESAPLQIGIVQQAEAEMGAANPAVHDTRASSALNPADGPSRSFNQLAAVAAEEPPQAGDDESLDRAAGSVWNAFQRRLAGTSLSRAQVSQLYHEEQQALRQQSAGPADRRAAATRVLASTPPGVQGDRAAAAAELPTFGVSTGRLLVQGSDPSGGAALPLELGYLAVRLPPSLAHLRGHHRCSWASLLQRFNVSHQQWSTGRTQYFLPRFRDQVSAETVWVAQGLRLPIPIDPGVGGQAHP